MAVQGGTNEKRVSKKLYGKVVKNTRLSLGLVPIDGVTLCVPNTNNNTTIFLLFPKTNPHTFPNSTLG